MSSAVENMQQKVAVRKPFLLFLLKKSREHIFLGDNSERAWALNKKSLDYGRDAAGSCGTVTWVTPCRDWELQNCSAWLVCKVVFECGYEQ